MKSNALSITPTESLFKSRDPFYGVIQSKIPRHAEVVVNLFDHCNMRCVFCPQDHEDETGMSRAEILSKVNNIASYINDNPSKVFHLHMMGGELFQDQLIDAGFLKHYTEFMVRLQVLCDPDKIIKFNYITNLVLERTEELLAFISKHDLEVAISYDPTGRFNREQLAVFKRNVEIFRPFIRIVSLTMTKKSIEKMLAGDEYFDHLYSYFTCDWDHLLVGSDTLKVMVPAQSLQLKFYKLLIDKYPNCLNISTFVEVAVDKNSERSTMPCTRGNNLTIFSDNSIPTGCSGSVILKHTKTKDLGGAKIVRKFLEEYDCLNCEYYSRCGFTCFIANDNEFLVKDVEGCVYKAAFKYAEDKQKANKDGMD